MKSRNAFVIAMGAALTCAGPLALSSEIVIRVPDTEAARSASELIAKAGRAFKRYLDACGSSDARNARDVHALRTAGPQRMVRRHAVAVRQALLHLRAGGATFNVTLEFQACQQLCWSQLHTVQLLPLPQRSRGHIPEQLSRLP